MDHGVTAAGRLAEAGRPLIIAHRGASAHAPENTLPAFRMGIEAGSLLVELDYHHSRDGVPIVIHDKTLDRTTDAAQRWGQPEIAVVAKDAAELATLDAGSWFDEAYADTRLPTLDEALTTIQAGGITLIERKAGDAQTLVTLLERRGLLDHVVVQSFDWDFLEAVRALAPKVVLGALGSKTLEAAALDRIVALGAHAVGWRAKDVTPAMIAAVHERKLELWVYTVDDEGLAEKLVEGGVDGIITNRPAEMRRHLRK